MLTFFLMHAKTSCIAITGKVISHGSDEVDCAYHFPFRNILLKNVVDVLLCAICWWMVGYGLENGASGGGFIGWVFRCDPRTTFAFSHAATS